MTMPDIRLRRMINQQLTQPQFTTPLELVRWMGAVQAQDFLASLWGVGSRIPGSTEQRIEQAIADRAIVRTWPMRGTVHLVPAEDACWMVRLMGPRVIQKYRSYHQKAGLNEEIFARSREIFVRALEGGRQRTRGELYQLLEAEGISTANTRGLFIIGQLAHEGLVCLSARQGKQPTLALLDEFAPNARALSREEGLAEMALRYFRSHGPATVQDFVWWTGLTVTDARVGLETIKGQMIEEALDGQTYWWMEPSQRQPAPEPTLHLLPAYDEYLVSYKDRSAALDPRYAWLQDPRLHLGPTLIIDGQVAGTWKRSIKKKGAALEVMLTRKLDVSENTLLEAAAQRYSAFLGLPVVLTVSEKLGG